MDSWAYREHFFIGLYKSEIFSLTSIQRWKRENVWFLGDVLDILIIGYFPPKYDIYPRIFRTKKLKLVNMIK